MKYTARRDATLIDQLLEMHGAKNKTHIKKIAKHSYIWVNELLVKKLNTIVLAGQHILLQKNEKTPITQKPNFKIVWEDDFLIVVEKPSGILSAGVQITRKPTMHQLINEYLKEKNKRAFVIHRLDKEVMGLMLFAKTEECFHYFIENWRTVQKKYLALTENIPNPPEGNIYNYLIEKKEKMFVLEKPHPEAKEAITLYKVKQIIPPYCLVELHILTGRKNQIRAHLQHIQCSIVGDYKYGASSEYKRKIRLMAFFIEFLHPVNKKKLVFELQPSPYFLNPQEEDET
ncbi:MAG: RNA pseudouridine synthase [Chitinophagaceae bacterium]|nr:RNA pseudouridine synthase [Chitinophagaceae bacterium]